jgi:hypothetical protein
MESGIIKSGVRGNNAGGVMGVMEVIGVGSGVMFDITGVAEVIYDPEGK